MASQLWMGTTPSLDAAIQVCQSTGHTGRQAHTDLLQETVISMGSPNKARRTTHTVPPLGAAGKCGATRDALGWIAARV